MGTWIDWLMTNKEWLFSGAALFVLGGLIAFVRWLFKKAQSKLSNKSNESTPANINIHGSVVPRSTLNHKELQECVCASIILWPSPKPDYDWLLADRRSEFNLVERMITGQTQKRILLVKGPSAIGKTVFLNELESYAHYLELPVASLNFKGCPSLNDMVDTLLMDLGSGILQQAHAVSGTDRFSLLISDLQQIHEPLLLIFDTYDQASEDARNWLENQLLPRLERAPCVVVLIGGQQIPDYDKYLWRKLTEIRELQPIQEADEWLKYSQRKWECPHLKTSHVEAFTLYTDGDPGQLHMLLESMVQQLSAKMG